MAWAFKLGSGETDITTKVVNAVVERSDERIFDSVSMNILRDITETLTIGDEFRVYRDGTLFFGGRITEITKGEIFQIKALEWGHVLKRTLGNTTFQSQTPEAIFQSLINTYTDLTPNIQTSGLTLQKWVIDKESLMENLRKLADLLDWQIRVEPDKNIYFEKRGKNDSGTTLTVGTEIIRIGKWKQTDTQVCNKLTLIGGKVTFQQTDNDTGDGSTKAFTLTYKPFGDVKITDAGSEVSPNDYSVDKENKTITFDTAPTNTDALVFYYQYMVPIEIEVEGDSSYTNDVVYEKRKEVPFLKTYADARAYGRAYLQRFENPNKLKTTELRIKGFQDVNLGYLYRIIDSYANINEKFAIKKIKWSYPKEATVITVGEEKNTTIYDWALETGYRLSQLERDVTDRSIVHKYVRARSEKDIRKGAGIIAKTRTIEDSFIVGHPINGKIGMGTRLDACDATGNWATSGDASAIATDSTTKKEGTNSLKVTIDIDSQAGDDAIVTDSTTSNGDLSSYTGANTGDPLTGSVGIWFYVADTDNLKSTGDVVTFDIGSDSSNYATYTKTKADLSDGWNYLVWVLPEHSSITGTPNWQAVDYKKLTITHSNTGDFDIYFDYITIASQYEDNFTNNSFENWTAGEPDNWTKEGTVTSTEETVEIKHGSSSLKLEVSGTSGDYYQAVPNLANWQARGSLRFGAWVKTSTASLASLSYHDSVTGNVFGTTHSGGGDWEFLTLDITPSQGGVSSKCKMRVSGTGTAYFDYPIVLNPIALNGIGGRQSDYTYQYVNAIFDDYSSDTTDDYTTSSGTWTIGSGVLNQSVDTPAYAFWKHKSDWTDFVVQGKIKGNGAPAIVFRANGISNWYGVLLDVGNGYVRLYRQASTEGSTLLQSETVSLSSDTWYWLKIKMKGNKCKAWTSTDGRAWTKYIDYNVNEAGGTIHTSGTVGFRTGNSPAATDFDNLICYEI